MLLRTAFPGVTRLNAWQLLQNSTISPSIASIIPILWSPMSASALFMPGLGKQEYVSRSPHIEIVHGWSDDIIPVENSIRYAKQADSYLHILSENHTLKDSIDVVERLFEAFLVKVLV